MLRYCDEGGLSGASWLVGSSEAFPMFNGGCGGVELWSYDSSCLGWLCAEIEVSVW